MNQIRNAVAMIALTICACAPAQPTVYICTMTHERILGEPEVREYRVTAVRKKGWLTSDRYHLTLEDGSHIVVPGRWTIELTSLEDTND